MNTMHVSRIALVAALALTLATPAFAWQPPPDGRDNGPGGRRFDGPPPEGPPPGRPPRDGFGPGGPPPGPGGRPDPFGPPPLSPLENRDAKLRELLKEEDDVRVDCDQLAEAAREDESKIEDLRTAVSRHFEIRHEIRQRKVELLEQELKALKDSLAQRQERKSALVEDRLSELLGKPSPNDF